VGMETLQGLQLSGDQDLTKGFETTEDMLSITSRREES
jgi:hypothetical protein